MICRLIKKKDIKLLLLNNVEIEERGERELRTLNRVLNDINHCIKNYTYELDEKYYLEDLQEGKQDVLGDIVMLNRFLNSIQTVKKELESEED